MTHEDGPALTASGGRFRRQSAGAPGWDGEADAWLAGKARGGDLDAFEVLIGRHRGRIYRIALRMLGNYHDAEDVAQEVIIQLWTALTSFAGASAFTTWLYRIVVNRCWNAQRRQLRTSPLDERNVPPAAAGPEDTAVARQHVHAVFEVMAALPVEQRGVLVLYQLEGLSYRETAAVLGITEAAVRSRLLRARRMLVNQLKGWT
ncbi:RNA polymerase sigma-70 factor (ECF subfamily) [Actinopolyspora lacussalsi]|nr:RNA polymerase sigma-70 factor (ECF subfamily) [Actinopolyspora lacussalsi]